MEPAAGGRRLRLATGLVTMVSEAGNARGLPPVLLVHGWAGSRRSFSALIPLLEGRLHVAAVDLRGHGDADKTSNGYDLASLAADVVATLDALDLGRAVLVGASSGGYVAQQVAVDAPDRVAALVLAGSPRDLRGRREFADELDGLVDPVDPAWVRSVMAGFADLERLPSWYVDVMVEDGLRLPAATWKASLRGLVTSVPPTDVGLIEAPTLVISGGRDDVLGGEQTAALVAAIPGAQRIDYPETGHLVLEEQPDRLAADILHFLADLRAGA